VYKQRVRENCEKTNSSQAPANRVLPPIESMKLSLSDCQRFALRSANSALRPYFPGLVKPVALAPGLLLFCIWLVLVSLC